MVDNSNRPDTNKAGGINHRLEHARNKLAGMHIGQVAKRTGMSCIAFPKMLAQKFHKHNHTMVGRIQWAFLGGSILVYAVSIAALWWTSTSVIHDNVRLQAGQWIEKLDELSAPLYISPGDEQMEVIRKHMQNFPEVAYVYFYTSEGRQLLGEYKDAALGDTVFPRFTEQQVDELKALKDQDNAYRFVPDYQTSMARVSAPLWVESIKSDGMLDFSLDEDDVKQIKIIGFIDLGLNFKAHQQQLSRSMLLGSAIIAAVFLVLLIIGRLAIKKSLSPLTQLQEPLMRLANGEEYVQVDVKGDEEIVTICNAFNATMNALKSRDEELNRLANHDSLTSLANRHSFTKSLEREVDRIVDENTSSALLFVDLDKFKFINDTFGHAAGDRLLKKVAELLVSNTRNADLVARFGGDEFAIIARGVNLYEADKIAAQLVEGMQQLRFVEDGETLNVYFSVGVAMIENNRFSADEILSQADMACFQAKANGRNGYHINDASGDVRKQMEADVGWSQKLRQALDNDHFKLFFQPVINLKNGEPFYHEALLRLPDRNSEMIYPEAFLPSAERFGMSTEIDDWVMSSVIAELARLDKAGKPINISINLSPGAIEDDELVSRIRLLLQKHKLTPSRLVFEIREHTALRNMDKVSTCINELHELGCKLALDCFGSGFDSFNYLLDWPVDYLKIDGNFIEKITTSKVNMAMVKSMVQIATTIGKKTIACHVGDDETIEELCAIGVDYAQGFHIGEPAGIISEKKYPLPARAKRKNNIKSIR